MTRRSWPERLGAALDARLALHNFLYEVPAYANTLPYLLGALALMGLLVLVGTGVLLGQFYVPDPAAANASIRAIMTAVPAGPVLRGIHAWAADLTLIVVILHMLRVFVTGSYRFPRDANWTVGVALLATVLAFYFTRTVMRWDQEASRRSSTTWRWPASWGQRASGFPPPSRPTSPCSRACPWPR